MSARVAMLMRKPPYGTVYPAEGFRAMMGSAAFETDLCVVFLDDGVYALVKGQDPAGLDMKPLGEGYPTLSDVGITEFYVHDESLAERGLAPAELDLHLVLDTYGSHHKHPKVKAWLLNHPRYRLHFTPTDSAWLNQVERWFGLISQRAIRRGSCGSVKELVQKIDQFVSAYNEHCTPFVWQATAESIREKIGRLCERISGTEH